MNRHSLIILLLLLTFVLAGCAGLTPDSYKGYTGETKPESEVAIVRDVSARIHEIDGKKIEHRSSRKYYRDAHLTPGKHTITLRRWFTVSVTIVPRGSIDATSIPLAVDLRAGHVYELHADRTTGPGFKVFFWIEDSETGELVAGMRKE